MKTILLVDFNNNAMRCIHMPRVGMFSGNPSMDFWAYLVFNHIYEFALHIGAQTKDQVQVVLALDGRGGYWRKHYYTPYKADRGKDRTPQEQILWNDTVYPAFDSFLELIKATIPWAVVGVEKCEADDVIAVLSKSITDANIIIHSTDSDYIQLLAPNVQVYNPISGYVTLPGEVKVGDKKVFCESVEEFVTLSVLTGQSGKDNVYNIMTPTDWVPTEQQTKKPPFGPVGAKKIWQAAGKDMEKLANYLQENKLHDTYARNNFLINLEMIPGDYCDKILNSYDNAINNLPDVNIVDFHASYRWPSLNDVSERVELAEILSMMSGKPIASEGVPMNSEQVIEEVLDLGDTQADSVRQIYTI